MHGTSVQERHNGAASSIMTRIPSSMKHFIPTLKYENFRCHCFNISSDILGFASMRMGILGYLGTSQDTHSHPGGPLSS
jgi:hypothetical protein